MTDKEIMKDLEHCSGSGKCRDCSYYKLHSAECLNILGRDALDLIKRKQAEIERLEKEKADIANANKIVKADAIKEFAERLKKHCRKMEPSDFSSDFWDYAVLVSDIDKLVNEMVGE